MLLTIRSMEGVRFCLIVNGAFGSNLTSKMELSLLRGMCIVLLY
jgi:hypothetical protein